MAPLPQNSTARIFVDYVTGTAATSVEHTVQFRVPSSEIPASAIGVVAGFFTAAGPAVFWAGWKPLRARYQAAGSNFSSPVVMPPALATFVGTGSLGAYNPAAEALEVTFQGRSPTTGRRVDISLYGVAQSTADLPPNFRIPVSGGSPAWAAAVLAWAGSNPTHCQTVDGSTAQFYPYININFNSYWETRLRRG